MRTIFVVTTLILILMYSIYIHTREKGNNISIQKTMKQKISLSKNERRRKLVKNINIEQTKATKKNTSNHKILYSNFSKRSEEFHKNQKYINKYHINSKNIKEFSQNPIYLNHAKDIISHLDRTKQIYKEKQAHLRIFSLKIIEEAAINFNQIEFITLTIKQVLKQYEDNKKHKGHEEDIIDLIHIWIQSFGKKNLLDQPYTLFEELNYEKHFRSFFATALKYSYAKEFENKKLLYRFLEYL